MELRIADRKELLKVNLLEVREITGEDSFSSGMPRYVLDTPVVRLYFTHDEAIHLQKLLRNALIE